MFFGNVFANAETHISTLRWESRPRDKIKGFAVQHLESPQKMEIEDLRRLRNSAIFAYSQIDQECHSELSGGVKAF